MVVHNINALFFFFGRALLLRFLTSERTADKNLPSNPLPPPFNPGLHMNFPRLLLTQEQIYVYAQAARYCNCSVDLIPLSFVLGKALSSSSW